MEVDFFATLLYDPTHAAVPSSLAQGAEASSSSWDPRITSPDRMADLACVWVDPFWSGLTCKRLGEPVLAKNAAKKKGGDGLVSRLMLMRFAQHTDNNSAGECSAVVFRVSGRFDPLPPSTIQRVSMDYHHPPLWPHDTAEPQAASWPRTDDPLAVCNSVKLHFLRTIRASENPNDPETTEFLYSSAFPLQSLLNNNHRHPSSSSSSSSSSSAKPHLFGLFNYNVCDTSADVLRGFCLALLPVAPTPLPSNTLLYTIPGPDAAHHELVMRLTQWLSIMMARICPGSKSDFQNMRTFLRDHGNTCLFQHMFQLFDAPGSCLPPTLALYALCAALSVNGGLAPSDFVQFAANVCEADAAARALFLRIVRDVVACFTLCCIEGLYWPDASLGASTEDVPFPLSFMPATRVFSKDDCEGRACHVQQMVALLRSMYRCAQRIGTAAFLAQIRALRSCRTLLPLSDQTLSDLLEGCCAIGRLLELGLIDVQTTVGDVHLADGNGHVDHDAPTSGHSFVLSMFRAPETLEESDVCVVEATGWQHRELDPYDRPITEAEKRFVGDRLLPLLQRTKPPGTLCGVMTTAFENASYERPALGHDRIYLTFSRKTRASWTTAFGAHIADLRRSARPFSHSLFSSSAQNKPFVAYITTRGFIEAIAAAPGPQQWPTDPDAPRMLRDYDALCRSIPFVRRCLRPPPKLEPQIEDLMCSRWHPIHETDLAPWRDAGHVQGVTCSIPSLPPAVPHQTAADLAEGGRMRVLCLPFMSSFLFNVAASA